MGLKRLMEYRPDKFQSSAFAVISEVEMIPLCEKYGIEYLMHENLPVGMKKNAGLSEVLKKDFDYLIELGSDDLMLNNILDLYLPFMEQGEDFLGCKRLILIDSVNLESRDFFFDPDLVQGLGRCMSKRMLLKFSGKTLVQASIGIMSEEDQIPENAVGFMTSGDADIFEGKGWITKIGSKTDTHLWDSINRGLDNNSTSRIMKAGYKFKLVETAVPLMADVKSDENIWGYNPEIGEAYDAAEFINKLSQEEKVMFFSNQKKLRAKRIEQAV